MKEIEEYFTKADLLPAIVQEAETGEVLMLAYMNRESFQKTLETGHLSQELFPAGIVEQGSDLRPCTEGSGY